MEEFTTNNVLKIFNMKRNTLQDWKMRKFIQATAHAEGVQGIRDKYSRDDVYRISVFKFLKETMGLSRIKLLAIMLGFQTSFTFKDVGPNHGDIKYMVIEYGLIPEVPGGTMELFSLHKEPPRVALTGAVDPSTKRSALVINLLSIKLDVDALIEQNL